jgi:hypothetical protein
MNFKLLAKAQKVKSNHIVSRGNELYGASRKLRSLVSVSALAVLIEV